MLDIALDAKIRATSKHKSAAKSKSAKTHSAKKTKRTNTVQKKPVGPSGAKNKSAKPSGATAASMTRVCGKRPAAEVFDLEEKKRRKCLGLIRADCPLCTKKFTCAVCELHG